MSIHTLSTYVAKGIQQMMNKNMIRVIYGDDPKAMITELLNTIRPEDEIDKNQLIGIKPNLVVAKPSSSGATTTPALVAGLVEYLKSKGLEKIAIMEGSWVGDRTSTAFKVCGYEEISRRYNVPLIDLQKDKCSGYDADGVRINVCDSVMKVGYLINMPVLKGHCQTSMTCALKNMKGCIPDSEKRRFHTMGLHRPIAHLNKIIRQDLIIVDGLNGDLNFEEGGNPVRMNRLIAGKDPVLTDAYVSQLMGYDIDEIPYITMARKIGVGSADLASADIQELNRDNSISTPLPSRRVQQLAKYISADSACSACYGSLVYALERLDEKGLLNRLKSKLCIGQNYKNTACEGIGIGSCTARFGSHIAGCPPKAKDIVEFLESICR